MSELRAAAEAVKHWQETQSSIRCECGRCFFCAEKKRVAAVSAVVASHLAEHPADDPQGRSIWEIELDKCREVMQRVHHLGKIKHIGLREVATALEQLFPPDDGEPITEAMLPGLGFGGHWGDKWRLQTDVIDIVWENGELCLASRTDKWQVVESGATLGELRRLLAALKVGQ